jgi:hypothetical protein
MTTSNTKQDNWPSKKNGQKSGKGRTTLPPKTKPKPVSPKNK